jgi:hypothetical protein
VNLGSGYLSALIICQRPNSTRMVNHVLPFVIRLAASIASPLDSDHSREIVTQPASSPLPSTRPKALRLIKLTVIQPCSNPPDHRIRNDPRSSFSVLGKTIPGTSLHARSGCRWRRDEGEKPQPIDRYVNAHQSRGEEAVLNYRSAKPRYNIMYIPVHPIQSDPSQNPRLS